MVNSPLPQDLGEECKKAAKILRKFVNPSDEKVVTDQFIPVNILTKAKGLAIFSVIKAGFVWSGRAGSGIVIARLPDNTWSAPSGIATGGVGFGGQIGAEVTDFVVVLNTADAVNAFSMGGNVTLGGNLSVAAGPIGRNAEADLAIMNIAPIFSYSKTKGLFAGVSIEGSVIVERKDANEKFYRRKVSAKDILSGQVPPPMEADELYAALMHRLEEDEAQEAKKPAPALKPKPNRMSTMGAGASAAAATWKPLQPVHQANQSASQSPPTYSENSANQDESAALRRPLPRVPTQTEPADQETATALFDYQGTQEGDLSFSAGDLVVVTRRTLSQNDWWTGSCNGATGLV